MIPGILALIASSAYCDTTGAVAKAQNMEAYLFTFNRFNHDSMTSTRATQWLSSNLVEIN